MPTNIEADLKEFSAVKARRAPWEPVWELIARYMFQRKQGFTVTNTPGDFYSHSEVAINTAGWALQTMVSSLDGALWKNGARTFKIKRPRQARDTAEIKEFYAEINARVTSQMEHEKAGFGTARLESFTESCAFGTDGLGVFAAPKGLEHKVEYRAMALKSLYIVEDAKGRVVKEFYECEYTADQLVTEYGDVAMTEAVKALIEANNHDTKLKVLWIVRPRKNVNKKSLGPDRFSYESVHILESEKITLREAGYSGNPIVCSRFYKNEGEEYGRSAGYNALAATMELCANVELITKGSELTAFPNWYVLDDGTFGNGVIDRSPGSVIPIDVTSSRITGAAPIGQIGAVGQLGPAFELTKALIEEINGHFFVDRLTDLNNKTRMTLGEAQIRNELRADSVGSVYSRQIEEKLTPTIRRTLAVLDEAGELGVEPGTPEYEMVAAEGRMPLVIPPELAELRRQGIEIYQISYVSPAARVLRSEELRGVISMWQFATGFGQVAPELLLRLDKKRSMEIANELYGAPDGLLLSEEEFQQALQSYQQSQAMMMQLQAAQAGAEIETKKASANQQNAQAQATLGGMNGLINGGGAPDSSMIL